MNAVRITRSVQMPDPVRISRYQKAPEFGPRVLFFSGGSALNGMSRSLKNYTHNSAHLVTPFDSGGSSAKLREAFDMPSIGDLRSRMMALADENVTGHPDVYRLFTHRFRQDVENSVLLDQLEAMIEGNDPLISAISNPMRRLIRNQLGYFRKAMPARFDLRGASIGNLILAGGYLNNHHQLDPIIFLFSKLVGVLGTVRAVVNDNLHLAAELEDGRCVVGQHRLTGKEHPPLDSPVGRLFLSKRLEKSVPATSILGEINHTLIRQAELICYPPGSFYTSLVANLLPAGVGAAIAATDSPKVYVPNLGNDPEQLGMSLDRAVLVLLEYLRANVSAGCPTEKLLNFILLDSEHGNYTSSLTADLMEELGVQVIDTRLVSEADPGQYDAMLLVSALLSMT